MRASDFCRNSMLFSLGGLIAPEGYKMRYFFSILIACAALAGGVASAQPPDYNNVGRAPTQEEIGAVDIGIGPSGKGLPPGSGTAKQGAVIFAAKCAYCHGKNLEGGAITLEA